MLLSSGTLDPHVEGFPVTAGLYCGLTGITFVQALRGTPLVGWVGVPSVPVSGLAALLLLASVCGTVVLATRWRRHTGTNHSAVESD
jgi:hypothetical protein